MTAYLLSAAGVIFLSVIVSLIIPEGKLNKSITFIMRLISILVLIQPISGIFKIGGTSSAESLVDYAYVSSVYSEHQSGQLEILLEKEYGAQTSCNVKVEYVNGDFKATAVEVGISENNGNAQTLKTAIENYLSELGYKNVTVFLINFE